MTTQAIMALLASIAARHRYSTNDDTGEVDTHDCLKWDFPDCREIVQLEREIPLLMERLAELEGWIDKGETPILHETRERLAQAGHCYDCTSNKEKVAALTVELGMSEKYAKVATQCADIFEKQTIEREQHIQVVKVIVETLEQSLKNEREIHADTMRERDALTRGFKVLHDSFEIIETERDTLRAALATLYRMYGDNDDHHPDDCPLDCHWHQVRMALATAQGKEEG